jgi:endoglucanase
VREIALVVGILIAVSCASHTAHGAGDGGAIARGRASGTAFLSPPQPAANGHLVSAGELAAAPAKTPQPRVNFQRGINLSGAEQGPGKLPVIYGTDYVYPTAEELAYYHSRGFEVVRLPIRWERLQPALFGDLDAAELARIEQFVSEAGALNMRVILDPHNYGRYPLNGNDTLIGTSGVPNEAFADFWKRLTKEFVGEKAIYGFSLMNEPHDSKGLWKASAQAGVDAIRSVDRDRLILAPGDQWSGAWSWNVYNSNFLLNDPEKKLIYEAHQYFDSNHSGTYQGTYDSNHAYPNIGIDRVRPFSKWLRKHHVQGIITEFGAPNDDPRWLEVVDRLLTWLNRNDIPWVYWAGGPRWGDYPLSAEPKDGVDAPVMAILAKKRPAH